VKVSYLENRVRFLIQLLL